MNVLVVVAHPDDEVLGVGATIHRLAKEHEVTVLMFCENSIRHGQPGVCRVHAEAAQGVLGYQRLLYLGYPDQGLDGIPFTDLVWQVENAVSECIPSLVITHSGKDLNRDHRIVCEAVRVATRSTKTTCTLLEFVSLGSNFGGLYGEFKPASFWPASEEGMEVKVRAYRAYTWEFMKKGPRSPMSIYANSRVYGAEAGSEYAEAFEVIREVK